MEDAVSHAARLPRGAAVAAAVTGTGAALGAVAMVTATVIGARTVVTPPRRRVDDTRILAVDRDAGTITLQATTAAAIDGHYGLWFERDSGHARVGAIVARTPAVARRPATVTRRLLAVEYGDLDAARRGRIGSWFYLTPRDLGLDFEDVLVPTTIGPAPAWLVPAAEDTGRWVVQVHGWGVHRAEGLRGIPVFAERGYTSLLISYRNDGIAPSTRDNRYALGDTEWLDVEAALRFALDHGATEVVLMGWSMGGATVLQTLTRSRLSHVVRGVVLESPVVDWVTALHFQGTSMRLPRIVRAGVLGLIGSRRAGFLTGQAQPVDLARLNFIERAGELDRPTLILHSDDDDFVPSTASHALAEARPDLVTFEPWTVAGHTRLWNLDPERWEAAIADWLRTLPS